jgi:hypothetical protein
MTEKVKIGVRIDEQLWEDFRTYVEETRQRSRGVLGEEVEIALEERMFGENQSDSITRIEDDVATIKAMLAESDGGAAPTVSDDDVHTHTPNEKPAANAPRSEKIDYLIDEYIFLEGGSMTKSALKEKIKQEYGFEDRTLKSYCERILSKIDAKKHPDHGNFFVWGDALEDAIEDTREKRESEAKDDVQDVME